MRKNLQDQIGQRKKFRAVFTRYGKKVNYKGYTDETVLLTHVTDIETDTLVTDHQWFALTKAFEKVPMKEGDTIEFEARVKTYKKGYLNRKLSMNIRQTDFKLSHPTHIRVVR